MIARQTYLEYNKWGNWIQKWEKKMLHMFGYLAWRYRVWQNRRRHPDILDDLQRGAMSPSTTASIMLMRDSDTWHADREKGIAASCPDLFDYDARVPYRWVLRRRAERKKDLDALRAGRE